MRADPVVSQRLQQAAEQLQAAILSTRKWRKAGDDGASTGGAGKAWRLAPTVLLAPERDEFEAVSDEDEETIDWEQQQSSQEDADSNGTSLASGTQSPRKREEVRAGEAVGDGQEVGDSVDKEMRKALDWMQRDVERQARENRTVRETLVRTIHDITDIIADFVSPEAAELLVRTAAAATGGSLDNNAAMLQLAPGQVDELVVQWEDALVSWREQNLVEKQELVEGFAQFEDECLARMKGGEASHRSELERLAYEANIQQMVLEDYASSITQKLGSAQDVIESLQRQIATLSSQLQVVTATRVRPESCNAATETDEEGCHDENLQCQVLDLAARAKSSELYALRCEVALEGQTQRTHEIETRLNMLLEECEARHNQRDTFRTNTVQSETVQMHQQKLELLEGRMQDVLQQVACDHEQFEYEQAKWALEKRHHREKYDEVLDASVKVLKVLIIREKLMKKHERVQKRRSEECQEKQLELVCQAATLQGITNELMQQTAMVLLVLQQLAVLKANVSQSDCAGSWTLPAKPVQMKTMIKRLKKIEAALGRRDWLSVDTSTASMPTTKVSPYPAGKDTGKDTSTRACKF